MGNVKEGDAAPDFELPTDGGGRFRLSEQRGFPVVLYFYPKDHTSGCTKEAIEFHVDCEMLVSPRAIGRSGAGLCVMLWQLEQANFGRT